MSQPVPKTNSWGVICCAEFNGADQPWSAKASSRLR
jgi:hypothetical protein